MGNVLNKGIKRMVNNAQNAITIESETTNSITNIIEEVIIEQQKEDKSRIRLDAQKLLDCAHEVCEKHLYHTDIKQTFIASVESFTTEIIERVESGAMSYEEGSKKSRKKKKACWNKV